MTDEHAKLRVKLGTAEFDGEGLADWIKEQYAEFLTAAVKTQAPATKAAEQSATPPPSAAADIPIEPAAPPLPPVNNGTPPPVQREDLRRVFAEHDAVVSLLAIPRSENADADALLLLVYGYHELRQNDYPVSGVRLMQSAKQSGLTQVDRIDRIISLHARFVNSAGAKRGKRYSLNNQGIIRATQLIREILA
jgi:hypothetical protein